jgi:hypothetical protein
MDHFAGLDVSVKETSVCLTLPSAALVSIDTEQYRQLSYSLPSVP